jgi:Na+/H+-dicarboxylate symporter
VLTLIPIHRLYAELAGLVEKRLWAKVLAGLLGGVLLGALLAPSAGLVAAEHSRVIASWLALPGDLFIRLVQMIMIPLVVASIVQGIAGGGERKRVASMGMRVGLYFLGTTVVAITCGLSVALLLKPGAGAMLGEPSLAAGAPSKLGDAPPDLPSLITGLLPTNPLASMLSGEMLSIVIFAIILGAALVSMPKERAEPMLTLLFSVQEICMTITKWAMRLAPFAVFGLMVRTTTSSGLGFLAGLGLYVLTVLLALLVILLLYTLLIAFASPLSVGRFFSGAKNVLLLAFSMASSAAVMPLTMKTAEEEFGVPAEVARFIVPVGAIINMNGTAAYQAVATIFLSQVYGLQLSVPTLLLVVVTTVAASIGTPSAPGAGIVILATVLGAAGIPAEAIALILGVDHVLGMCRTSVNVAGDLTACVLFARQPAGEAALGASSAGSGNA